MGASLESERPMMAPSVLSSNRASTRYSTYSTAPSMATSSSPLTSSQQTCHAAADPAHEHEITQIQTTLSKLSDKKLASQRFVPSQEKTENLSKLALGAKLDRALARRMGGQDAVMRVKSPKLDEKVSEKVAAN